MSTSENPETPPLTRRQLRELRNTGATPIITPQLDEPAPETPAEPEPTRVDPQISSPSGDAPIEEAPIEEASAEEPVVEPQQAPEVPAKKGGVLGGLFGRGKADKSEAAPDAADEGEPSSDEVAPAAPESTDATAPAVTEHPIVPASFAPASDPGDLGVTGLTRRQARAQERIRTASVPIISPDLQPGLPAPLSAASTAEAPADEEPAAEHAVAVAAADSASPDETPSTAADNADERKKDSLQAIFRPAATEETPVAAEPSAGGDEDAPVSTVNPALGSDLLAGQTPEISLPPSFDQLIARGPSTGSVSTPNALILSQTPSGVPLVGPVTSTGEVLITGTFELPEGLGSAGHAPGTTDGRDVDAVLLDGELPPASSPTPIAASAAISTVKQPGEIIRPPAPEKGSKLVIGLIITTGALAVAVAVALVLAFTTGVFG
ncbi:hypothetical protein [Microbacterium sp. Bi128]|uniref:hypothetical protein n=1 Tax=Microbacterium sp. Bi128 TaxID=2821115 RepID=UPI001DF544CD|nr:hypothetical protein [Microbacterium sp. Bi128]CAH0232653.1 hypothetical protein SRABI128_02477 [Microbacterium sp. Bi128]